MIAAMDMPEKNDRKASLSVLVALASYGTSNDRYLKRVIHEYQSMPFDIDIVVISNIEKRPAPGVECLAGLPNKNPWSLPFAHKKLFVEHADKYDLFIYSEDDILITQENLRALLDVTAALQQDEIAGFLRIEKGTNGDENYPDIHDFFHWDSTSVRSRGQYTLAHFTNEHAACYVLTKAQLKKAIGSGGFLVEPHEKKYDLLCTAATDPYTQCGLKKLIPFSHLDAFTVHHLSNKYVDKVGITASQLRGQLGELFRIAEGRSTPAPLFNTETNLPRAMYSKDYYEPVDKNVVSAVPKTARNVLSIGCGWGATEREFLERGLRVVAMPLDPVISASAVTSGIELVHGNFESAAALIRDERFDCVLCLNVLHLARKPEEVLSWLSNFLSAEATIIIQSPNMISLRAVRQALSSFTRTPFWRDFKSAGAHFTSTRTVRNWCVRSGLEIIRTKGVFERSRHSKLGKLSAAVAGYPALLTYPLATSVIVSAKRRQEERRQAASANLSPHRQDANLRPMGTAGPT
jgi:2-polyprenyl-3-methyl-5-hydroxy-6-metoxy-1,4-benzoquinol methylase